MTEAIEVLSKVQLLQKSGKGRAPEVGQMLIQVQNIVMHSNLKHYRDVLQSDLWDFLSSANSFLPKQKGLSALTTGQDPIPGGGAAAGAKSYNSRSGQIFGILSQMKDEFGKDLSEAQTAELRAMISFQNLKAAKLQ